MVPTGRYWSSSVKDRSLGSPFGALGNYPGDMKLIAHSAEPVRILVCAAFKSLLTNSAFSTSTFQLVDRESKRPRSVLAAGSGSRVGSEQNKVFLPLSGRRIVSWSLISFAQVRPGQVNRFIMVIREEDRRIA